ncbi:MAG: energy-coupling factor ABC transporter permease [Firmicutes bacterium]|nr:energy-coupling factor ABC transporter permease [Bacillota bacterium]
MHIPDGFLDARTWIGATAAGAGAVGYSLKKTREVLEERQIPLLGVIAAFIFAAQMVNFPVAGGTSGHLIGAVLAAILLGPWAAGLVMTVVIMVQALFFGDGGITALGANVLNMAFFATFSGYYAYRLLSRLFGGGKARATGTFIVTFLASWFSVVTAATAAALELAASGTVPLGVVLPAMLFWHVIIGIGEGVITAVAVSFVTSLRPDLQSMQLAGPSTDP